MDKMADLVELHHHLNNLTISYIHLGGAAPQEWVEEEECLTINLYIYISLVIISGTYGA